MTDIRHCSCLNAINTHTLINVWPPGPLKSQHLRDFANVFFWTSSSFLFIVSCRSMIIKSKCPVYSCAPFIDMFPFLFYYIRGNFDKLLSQSHLQFSYLKLLPRSGATVICHCNSQYFLIYPCAAIVLSDIFRK